MTLACAVVALAPRPSSAPVRLDPQGLLMLIRCEPGSLEALVERTRAPAALVSTALAELAGDSLVAEVAGTWVAVGFRPLRDRVLEALQAGVRDVDEVTGALGEDRDHVWEMLNRLCFVEGLVNRRVELRGATRRELYGLREPDG